MAALRRLVGLPGNLDLKPHSLFQSLFEEVGWEQDLVAEPELLAEEVERLPEQADRRAELRSEPKEASSLASTLRSLAQRLRRANERLEREAAVSPGPASESAEEEPGLTRAT